MYEFQPRFPIDHALKLVSNIRTGDFDRGDNLLLVGAIAGEIGALLKTGFNVGLLADEEVPSTIAGCCEAFDRLAVISSDSEPQFDPTPFIPIILRLIELWLARRGK